MRLWNPAAERIFGWTREEIVGRGGLPMAPESRRAESEALFTRVRAGESLNDFETVRQRKDGTLVAVSIAAAPIRDGSGQVVGNMVAYTDIGERKAQEAEVHRLNDELHARLDELAASRSRIVAAGDVERRRLERNLHDGAQQRLVALSLALRLARKQLDSDPDAARAALAAAGDELSLALDELRELARGLHPAVLSDHGLRTAVHALATRAPLPVEIEDVPDGRLPEPVEAGAYYLIAEALTNVTKYAEASVVRVRVEATDGSLVVEVADDGVGGADPAGGSGLRGLADRVEALGGSLEVVSPAGAGHHPPGRDPARLRLTASAGRRARLQRVPRAGRRGAVAALPVPRDVEQEHGQVRARGRTHDRGEKRREALDGVEPEPGADQGAARRRREARELRRRVPVALYPGEVDAQPDRRSHRDGREQLVVERDGRASR